MNMFKKIAHQYQEDFYEFQPFPKINDRSFWDHLSDNILEHFEPQKSDYIDYDYPILPISKFMDYKRHGNRADYESIYFERRRHLNTAVLLECIYNNDMFMDTIINGIFLLCEESAWQLPAHNSYIRDTPSHIVPDHSRPILDLFACETGALLAMIDYLLGDKLDGISLQIRSRIHQELDLRIIRPYLNEHFWWMGHGDEPMNNWTIWCTQNILFTFFLTPQSDVSRKKAFQKANVSIDYFLKEYGDDGCCDEGALYYRHSGLCLFNTIELLNAITHNAYIEVYAEEKIQNMCAYIYYVHVNDRYYINFSDCSAVLERFSAREFLFAKRTQNENMMAHVAWDYKKSDDPFIRDEINLFYRLQNIQHYDTIVNYPSHDLTMPPDIYYESVGLMVVRDNTFTLAVKSGDNDDNHNHNDTGSFTLYKHGLPVFVDIGVESYTAKTFSKDRYSIWTMQSDYHNLPTLNGKMQLAGKDYKATEVHYQLDLEAPSIYMNLAHAYTYMTSLSAFYREVTLYKGEKIKIKDHLECGDTSDSFDFVSNLITYIEPKVEGNDIFLEDWVHIHLDGSIHSIDVEPLAILDPRLQKSWDHDLYRLRIHMASDTLTISIR